MIRLQPIVVTAGWRKESGNFPPVVISDRSNGDFEFDHASQPDYIYIGKEDPENLPDNFRLLVDAHFWKERPNAILFLSHRK